MIHIGYILLSGKDTSAKIKSSIKKQVTSYSRHPKLAVILVGNNNASQIYVSGKEKDCIECGIDCEVYRFEDSVTELDLINQIERLNNQSDIDGILVQLPLPKHIDKNKVIESIDKEKDVDCFRADNIGNLILGQPNFIPCTPSGILSLLQEYNISVEGKHCVVIGRSDIVGKPMAALMTNMGATVTICHSKTVDLYKHTASADIIICAVGKTKFLTAEMVKDGAVIIDVGINRDEFGKLCGDVDFESVSNKCTAITPVPGGVGLMTRAALLTNIIKAYNNKLSNN